MTQNNSDIGIGTGLYYTNSRNESIKSYESSVNSTITKSSVNSTIQSKVKSILNRKRSQSLNISNNSNSIPDSQNPNLKFKLMRNRSLVSILPNNLPSLTSSSTSTRDNSISSLSDVEIELPLLSPLTKIDENSTEQTGVFAHYSFDPKEQEKINRIKNLSRNVDLSENDIDLYDNIADNILKKVNINDQNNETFEWKF